MISGGHVLMEKLAEAEKALEEAKQAALAAWSILVQYDQEFELEQTDPEAWAWFQLHKGEKR